MKTGSRLGGTRQTITGPTAPGRNNRSSISTSRPTQRSGNPSGEQGPKMTPQQNLDRARKAQKDKANLESKKRRERQQRTDRDIKRGKAIGSAIGKGVKSFTSAAAQSARGSSVPDSPSRNLQGSQEIIRGKRG